ncbi:MAG TPA: NYN domain-containing protein [Dissulfurispiraceae bacterium]|nr:NYN domain-containing protein [Dissulfurispiraceae bacterium]
MPRQNENRTLRHRSLFGGSAIASIIIDGYNLIGTGHRNLEKAREGLCERLFAYHRAKGHNVTLVFDGHKGGLLRGSRDMRGGITVIYTGRGESADDAIRRIIAQERREWIVISSDRAIEQYAWSHDAVPVSSSRFEAILERSSAVPFDQESCGSDEESAMPGQDDEYEGYDSARSGNPRRLSKKDRAVQRALRKL